MIDGEEIIRKQEEVKEGAWGKTETLKLDNETTGPQDRRPRDCGSLHLAFLHGLWDNPTMKLVADAKGRLTSAVLFRPHSAYDARPMPDGSIRLVQLVEKELPKARIVKRGGRKYLTHERTVTLADTQRVMEEFP